MTSEDDIIIPLGVCAIKSKYRNRYLEMDFRGSEVRVSNDDILNSKKYFKAEKTIIAEKDIIEVVNRVRDVSR